MHFVANKLHLDLSDIIPSEDNSQFVVSDMKENCFHPEQDEEEKEIKSLLVLLDKPDSNVNFYFEKENCEEIIQILKRQPRTTPNYNSKFARSAPLLFRAPKQISMCGRVLKVANANDEKTNFSGTTAESSVSIETNTLSQIIKTGAMQIATNTTSNFF